MFLFEFGESSSFECGICSFESAFGVTVDFQVISVGGEGEGVEGRIDARSIQSRRACRLGRVVELVEIESSTGRRRRGLLWSRLGVFGFGGR